MGHATIISGDGALEVGKGPVRTGVTVVLPRGRGARNQVFAAWYTLNADGEMTGTTWIEESGILEGPVAITNTHSVGTVHQALIEWSVRHVEGLNWSLPVAAETWDGSLNDINGFHVRREHVFRAIELAKCASLGLGRNGSIAANGSGDIFIAFTTAHPEIGTEEGGLFDLRMLWNASLNPLFEATVEATEEAVVNAMVAAETMSGVNGNRVYAIPHERLREVLRKYNRLVE